MTSTHTQGTDQERKQRYKEERKIQKEQFIKSLRVGSILYTNWGYDQTNVEFFQIMSIKGNTVFIREVEQDSIGQTGYMSCTVIPRPNVFCGSEKKYIIQSNSVKISECRRAWLYHGKPLNCSWSA